MLGNFACCLSTADFFQNQLFRKFLTGTPSECHTVGVQNRPDVFNVGPVLGPNGLPMQSSDDTGRQRVNNVWTVNLHRRFVFLQFCNEKNRQLHVIRSRREKTGQWGFCPSDAQTSLLSYTDYFKF